MRSVASADATHTARAMKTLHYLAYGSNLHPQRLAARVPSARPLGVVPLHGRRLSFHKRGRDLSGKCLLYLTQNPCDVVFGVLYEIAQTEKVQLDRVEGAGRGYDEERLDVSVGGKRYASFLYAASASHIDRSLSPFHWYKRLVVAGARHHRLPQAYIAALEAVRAVSDADHKRVREQEALLARMERTG